MKQPISHNIRIKEKIWIGSGEPITDLDLLASSLDGRNLVHGYMQQQQQFAGRRCELRPQEGDL